MAHGQSCPKRFALPIRTRHVFLSSVRKKPPPSRARGSSYDGVSLLTDHDPLVGQSQASSEFDKHALPSRFLTLKKRTQVARRNESASESLHPADGHEKCYKVRFVSPLRVVSEELELAACPRTTRGG